jgi:hypothetical protein
VITPKFSKPPGYQPPAAASVYNADSRFASTISYNRIGEKELEIGFNLGGPLKIQLDEYLCKHPMRKYETNWIFSSDSAAVYHPRTGIPFWFNPTGSAICFLCDGQHSVQCLITELTKRFSSTSCRQIVHDLLSFLLLLSERDLIDL